MCSNTHLYFKQEACIMIYTEQTKKAMVIAYNAHHGQLDKCGIPYIYHPIHLAEQMQTEEECIVALLHDTVEDTDVTFEMLEKEFSNTIVQAVKLLTRDGTVEYLDYVRNLKSNPIARNVKLADLKHNSDMSRLPNPTEKDWKRKEKYEKAMQILLEDCES